MLTDPEDTTLHERLEGARKVNAVASGIGPLIGIIFPLVPFLAHGSVFSMLEATLVAIGVGVAILFLFSAYLGSISKRNWIVAGLRTGLAGIVVAVLNLFLPT